MQAQGNSNSGEENKLDLKPVGDLATPAGYAAPANFQSHREQAEISTLSQLAQTILQDPMELRKLTDRVYELMQEDMRLQQERSRNYGGSFK